MSSKTDCIFCQIVKGDTPCFKIYEDDDCLAFLDIFPNTEGFTIVIPKKHYSSDFSLVKKEVLNKVLSASRKVSLKLVKAYRQVERCSLVFEGTEVDHLHAKIMPLHKTVDKEYLKEAPIDPASTYFKTYQGYITTRKPNKPTDVHFLTTIANKINQIYPINDFKDS